jgi:hypothetical protein
MTDIEWVRQVVGEHLITAHEIDAWVPLAATQHINNDTETT